MIGPGEGVSCAGASGLQMRRGLLPGPKVATGACVRMISAEAAYMHASQGWQREQACRACVGRDAFRSDGVIWLAQLCCER